MPKGIKLAGMISTKFSDTELVERIIEGERNAPDYKKKQEIKYELETIARTLRPFQRYD